jgi:hypothetical protein
MNERWIIILRKTARIWSVVIIGLGILMFVGEIIEPQSVELDSYPWFENLIPVTLGLSIVGLAVALKREGIGGGMAVGFALVNLLFYIATGRDRVGVVTLILTPIALPGFQFLILWWYSRDKTEPKLEN